MSARTTRRVAASGVLLATALLGSLLVPATPAVAATRVPGTPVAPLAQVNQSRNGGDNASRGLVRATKVLGTPDAGVVPKIGLVGAVADDGAYVAYESRVDTRTVDLMISSPALAGAVPVRVFLPPSWKTAPTRTFPSLYLLPGASEKADYQAWSLYSSVKTTTARAEALIVMPSVGSTGIGSNWTGAGRGYQYDTFLATELPQLLQRGYRASARAAVAGISTGGLTALTLATQHPGRYAAVASYSGLLNPSLPVVSQLVQGLLIREGLNPFALWGDPLLFGFFTWQARDPANSTGNLRASKVIVSSGNSFPGSLDPAGTGVSTFEATTLSTSQTLVLRARLSGVAVTTDFYGSGTHSWPYWSREFDRTAPALLAALTG